MQEQYLLPTALTVEEPFKLAFFYVHDQTAWRHFSEVAASCRQIKQSRFGDDQRSHKRKLKAECVTAKHTCIALSLHDDVASCGLQSLEQEVSYDADQCPTATAILDGEQPQLSLIVAPTDRLEAPIVQNESWFPCGWRRSWWRKELVTNHVEEADYWGVD